MTVPDVMTDLLRWGPDSPGSPVSQREAEFYCRRLALSHYENFPVASVLLPRRLHQHFYNVYAFCRWSDDLGDETGDPQRSLTLLDWWSNQLEACYAGRASHPVYVALTPTIQQFQLPQQLFADLIDAFVQDQTVRQYDTREQLLDYCRRSANPVGRLVLRLFEQVSDDRERWSDHICTGLQLANFWQDVARDSDIGRVYLPRADRWRHGYSDDDLAARRMTPSFLALMQDEVAFAREHLLAGSPLPNSIRGRLRVEVDLFIRGGLLILREIEAIDCRVWDQRPVVRKSQLLGAVGRSLLRRPLR